MAFGDDDRAYLLGQDFGVCVVYAGVRAAGQFDVHSEDVLPGQYRSQSGDNKSVLVATGSLSPVQGGTITVDGDSYTVVDVNLEAPDGRMTRIVLAG